MGLFDNVRQTLSDAAETAVEKGQNLSDQARLQVAIKKLQLERAKRVHELGTRTFEWYQSGSLTVGGVVPPDVTTMCHQLADVQHQLDETQRLMEEARLRAEEAKLPDPGMPQATATVVSSPIATPPPATPAPGTTPPPPSGAYGYATPGSAPTAAPGYTRPAVDHSTTVLPNSDPPYPPHPGSDPLVP